MATSKKLPKAGQAATIDPKEQVVSSTATQQAAEDAAQEKLRFLIERRHPEYTENVPHWEFMDDTYEGGREWFKTNIFQYIKEGDGEFTDRIERAYRFNHTREVVDLLNKYLFKQVITRSEDAPPSVQKFWKQATLNGLGIRDLARQASKKTSITGRIGVVVDNNKTRNAITKSDDKDVRTYAYVVGPTQLLDYSFDDDGDLNWVLIEECYRDDGDPLTSTGGESPRWRLWTKVSWVLYEEREEGKKKKIVEVDRGDHNLGEVPVRLQDHIIGDEKYAPPSLIDDIAYLDRAVANYLSNLDAIIQDQTFSQLAMPAQNVLPGEDAYTKMLDMGTKRVFLYDADGTRASPQYLSPDPKQATVIVTIIKQIINEIYHTVGLAGERTKQDNSMGIDNSSGVAKAYDFERVNALLSEKADALESMENWLARMVGLWNGEKVEQDYVSYPDNFDTRGLYDEFDLAARLMLIEAPKTVRSTQMEKVIEKLFPQLKDDLLKKMQAELQDWPVDPVQLAGDMASATADAQAQAQQTLEKTADRTTAKETVAGQ